MKQKKSTILTMWRTIKMWMILRVLQKHCNTTYNRNESKLIRQGKRQYLGRVEFTQRIAKSMADWSFYQKFVPKYHVVLDKPERNKVDSIYLDVESLLDSAINRDKQLIDLMSAKTGKKEDDDYIRISCHGDDFVPLFDFLQLLLTKYWLAWTVIVIPIFTAIYSGAYGIKVVLVWFFAKMPF